MILGMATKPKLGGEFMVSYLFLYCLSQALNSKQRRMPVFGARRWEVQTQQDYNLHH